MSNLQKIALQDFKSIAVIQTAFLGDFVLALPLLQIIRNNAPKSKISVVCTPVSSETASLASAIDNIVIYDKRNKHKGMKGIKLLAQNLKSADVDLIIAPHRSFRTTLLAKLTGAKYSVGFDKNAFSFLYSKKIAYELKKHEIERNISLLAAFDSVNTDYNSVDVNFAKKDVDLVDSLLKENNIGSKQSFVVIAPGSVWATKKWKIEHFAKLSSMLKEKGEQVVVIGSKAEKEDADLLAKQTGALNLCGKTSIPQSIYLLSRAKLLITNDSAPTHFAGLVACPTITLYGPTVPEFGFAPVGKNDRCLAISDLECRPCAIHGGKSCPLKHFDCMNKLSPEYVFQNAVEILKLGR